MTKHRHSTNDAVAQSVTTLPDEIIGILNESVDLLHDYRLPDVQSHNTNTEPLPSLLDQCRRLLQDVDSRSKPALRTVHHFACTGGTLIAKCLASMPNVQLLSEVNPLSTQAFADTSKFFPTDLVRLSAASSRGASQQLLVDIFMAGLEELYKSACCNGLRLVLRDHSHSDFCFGPLDLARPTLLRILQERYPVRSIVTVRHPLDSYLSLMKNGWRHFEPGHIDQYAVRYLAFLDHHSNCDLFKYEDFTESPDTVLKQMCISLDLPFNPAYEDLFPAFNLSGDSGRKSNTISSRDHRTVPDQIRLQSETSENWKVLCDRLGYSNIF